MESDPVMKEGLLFVLEDNIRNLTNDLPDLQGLIETHITGKAMRTLVFLLQKASEVTRLFNKQKSGSRARERVKILANLNTVWQNENSSVHEIEEAEVALLMKKIFDRFYLKMKTIECLMMNGLLKSS